MSINHDNWNWMNGNPPLASHSAKKLKILRDYFFPLFDSALS